MGAGSTYQARVSWTVALIWLACLPLLNAQQRAGDPAALTPVPRLVWFSNSFRPADGLPVAPVEMVTLAV
jgi:hypothetical protein